MHQIYFPTHDWDINNNIIIINILCLHLQASGSDQVLGASERTLQDSKLETPVEDTTESKNGMR